MSSILFKSHPYADSFAVGSLSQIHEELHERQLEHKVTQPSVCQPHLIFWKYFSFPL